MILMYISICISVHKEHDVAKNDMSNTRLFHLSMVATWAWCNTYEDDVATAEQHNVRHIYNHSNNYHKFNNYLFE